MHDREKVIVELTAEIEDASHCRHCGLAATMKNALSLLKEQEPGWISVKDRLPEEYGNYLAVVDGEVTECTYSGPFIKGIINGWSTCNANGLKWLRDEHVACWMPLPEPPKEG